MRKTPTIVALSVLVMAAFGTAARSESPEKCMKYLPTTGTSVEVPCEDAQVPEQDCDRLAANPFDPNHVTQGVAFAEIQQSAAVTACRKAVERNPQTPRFSYQLARALDRSGSYGEAIQLYRPLAEARSLSSTVRATHSTTMPSHSKSTFSPRFASGPTAESSPTWSASRGLR